MKTTIRVNRNRPESLTKQITDQLTSLIESGAFDGVPDLNPRETMQSALNLSRSRADQVRDSVAAFKTPSHDNSSRRHPHRSREYNDEPSH